MSTLLDIPPDRDLPPGRLESRRRHLEREILRAPAADPGVRSPRWRRRTAVRAAAVLGTAVAVVVAAVVVGVGPAGGPLAPDPVAAQALRSAAAAAASAVSPAAGATVHYTRTRGVEWAGGAYLERYDGEDFGFTYEFAAESWTASDGSGLRVGTNTAPLWIADRHRAAWEAEGSPPLLRESYRDRYVPGELHVVDLTAYPTDPGRLVLVIKDEAEQADAPVGYEMFVIVTDLLQYAMAPPELRAALYDVAAGLPGIEHLGPVVDRAGRSGVSVAMSHPDQPNVRHVLTFDPATSALLQSGTENTSRPELSTYTVFVESAAVTTVLGES